jgi:hypothetical protein
MSHTDMRAHGVRRLALLEQDMRKEFRRLAGCSESGDKASGRKKTKDNRRAPPADDAEWAARQDQMALLSALPDDLLLPHVPSDARLMPVPTPAGRREKQRAL